MSSLCCIFLGTTQSHENQKAAKYFFHGVYIKNVLGHSLSHGGLWFCFFASAAHRLDILPESVAVNGVDGMSI